MKTNPDGSTSTKNPDDNTIITRNKEWNQNCQVQKDMLKWKRKFKKTVKKVNGDKHELEKELEELVVVREVRKGSQH